MASKDNKTKELILPKNIFIGDPDAPVTLVEYGDYECATCAEVHEVVKALLQRFEGRIRFNFRHFPLTQIHQNAQKAAEAAIGAAQEGKFWEMHELLLANRRHLGIISLSKYAREAGVVNKKFIAELMDSAWGWYVRNDLLEGLDKGVREVPTFLIDEEIYTGKPSLNGLTKAIEGVLKEKRHKAA